MPEYVFAEKSLESYKGKPIIITHDAGEVDKNNVSEEQIGVILSDGYRDGNNVRAEIIIHDTDKMKRSGLRELSLGYKLELDETPGIWNGQPYDAIQKNIEINHLALVKDARAGKQARLNIDSSSSSMSSKNISEKTPKKVQNLPKEKLTLKGAKIMSTKLHRDNDTPESNSSEGLTIEKFIVRRDRRLTDGVTADKPNDREHDLREQDEISRKDMEPDVTESTEHGDTAYKVKLIRDRHLKRDHEGDIEDYDAARNIILQQKEDIDTLLNVIDALEAERDFSSTHNKPDKTFDSTIDKKNILKDESTCTNADSLDKIIRERVALVRIGDRLNIDGLDTMNIQDAKKAIIKKVKPQMSLDQKGESYINAAFDLAISELDNKKDTDYQRRQMFNADALFSDTDMYKTEAERSRGKMIAKRNGGI